MQAFRQSHAHPRHGHGPAPLTRMGPVVRGEAGAAVNLVIPPRVCAAMFVGPFRIVFAELDAFPPHCKQPLGVRFRDECWQGDDTEHTITDLPLRMGRGQWHRPMNTPSALQTLIRHGGEPTAVRKRTGTWIPIIAEKNDDCHGVSENCTEPTGKAIPPEGGRLEQVAGSRGLNTGLGNGGFFLGESKQDSHGAGVLWTSWAGNEATEVQRCHI